MSKKRKTKSKVETHKVVIGEKTGDEIIAEHKLEQELTALKADLEVLAKGYADIAVKIGKLGFKIHMNHDHTAVIYRDIARQTIGEFKEAPKK